MGKINGDGCTNGIIDIDDTVDGVLAGVGCFGFNQIFRCTVNPGLRVRVVGHDISEVEFEEVRDTETEVDATDKEHEVTILGFTEEVGADGVNIFGVPERTGCVRLFGIKVRIGGIVNIRIRNGCVREVESCRSLRDALRGCVGEVDKIVGRIGNEVVERHGGLREGVVRDGNGVHSNSPFWFLVGLRKPSDKWGEEARGVSYQMVSYVEV
jgi:hypothetical protein